MPRSRRESPSIPQTETRFSYSLTGPYSGRRRCGHCGRRHRRGALSRAPVWPGVVADPGMCVSSLRGNREVSRLTGRRCVAPWSASGRRGAVADDERTREVRPRHSSWEADEQGGAIRCGAGGAKGGDQGKRGTRTARSGRRTGKARPTAWTAYGKRQGTGRRRGSPRSSTISASICSKRRSSISRRTLRLAWMG